MKHPLLTEVKESTIKLISSLDTFVSTYLLPHTPLPIREAYSGYRPLLSRITRPSIIHQVSLLEVTVDPYLKSLQANYYLPLQSTMPNDTNMQETENSNNGTPTNSSRTSIPLSSLQTKGSITVEDSIDIISEFISEIHSSEMRLILNGRASLKTPTIILAKKV